MLLIGLYVKPGIKLKSAACKESALIFWDAKYLKFKCNKVLIAISTSPSHTGAWDKRLNTVNSDKTRVLSPLSCDSVSGIEEGACDIPLVTCVGGPGFNS